MLGVGQWACDFDRFAGLEMSYLILFEYCMLTQTLDQAKPVLTGLNVKKNSIIYQNYLLFSVPKYFILNFSQAKSQQHIRQPIWARLPSAFQFRQTNFQSFHHCTHRTDFEGWKTLRLISTQELLEEQRNRVEEILYKMVFHDEIEISAH